MPAILRAPLKRQCLAILRERAIPFGTILDVGAQHGTLELRDAFPDYRHVLFEPVGSCRPHIERNYATVAHEIVTAAVSDEDGETEIVTATVTSGTDVSHAWMAGPHERGKGHPVVPMITLDSYTVSTGHSHHHFTRFRAPYVNPDGFRFRIYRKHFFTPLAKLLGIQDIEIGQSEFDHAFVIQGNDEERVRALFADESIRHLVAAQPDVSFMVRGDRGWFSRIHPEGVDELYFQAHGIIKDLPRLKELFALFGLVLDRLCELGSAYESSPPTKQLS